MVFTSFPLNTELAVKELLEGKLHWDHVSFAPMPEYSSTIYLENERVTCTVIDVSKNPVLKDIAKFIKQNFLQEK